MKTIIAISLLALTLTGCLITPPNLEGTYGVMQKEDIIGTWYGVTKVESKSQSGYFTDQPLIISIEAVDTSIYSIEDFYTEYYLEKLFFMTVEQTIATDQTVTIHAGYLHNMEEEYEDTLLFTFKSTLGGPTDASILFTYHKDTLNIKFSTYTYKVTGN